MPDEINRSSSIQNVRKRPAMYFGDLDAPTIANCLAIDQVVAKTCSRITSTFSADGFLSVTHNGKALSADPDSRFHGLSEMQSVAEVMYSCAERAASDYVHDICRHSMAALNALSGRFELHSYYDGSHYLIAYEGGELAAPLANLGETDLCGATVRFKPDDQLVGNCEFDSEKLRDWFDSLPIDTSGIEIEWNDFRGSIGQ